MYTISLISRFTNVTTGLTFDSRQFLASYFTQEEVNAYLSWANKHKTIEKAKQNTTWLPDMLKDFVLTDCFVDVQFEEI